jgi:hypothetical protein
MLALSSPAGHSGRSLTTTYETIAYYIHCNSGRRWLDDLMRQQEGDDDDFQLDVELNRGDHEEGLGREERDDYEEVGDHQEGFNQEEGGHRRLSSSIAVSYSVRLAISAP